MDARHTGRGRTDPSTAASMVAAGASVEVALTEGNPGYEAEDPLIEDLRALAAEVVRARGGVPRNTGYRPRLQRSMGWERATSVRRRPMRIVAVALVGFGAIAGALFLLRAPEPRDANLELAIALPTPTVSTPPAPAPPPPMTSVLDDLPKAVAPASPVDQPSPPAPESGSERDVPVARATAPIAADEVPESQPRGAPAARATAKHRLTAKHGHASPTVKPAQASADRDQRRGGRRRQAAIVRRGAGKRAKATTARKARKARKARRSLRPRRARRRRESRPRPIGSPSSRA